MHKYPRLRKLITSTGRVLWHLWWKIRKYFTNKTVDWDQIFYVSPDIIRETASGRFNIWKDKGKVLNGDWDLPQNRNFLENTEVYQAVYQRYKNFRNWDETKYYSTILHRIESGEIVWDSTSKGELDDVFNKLDLLYAEIERNGYKTQRELHQNSRYFTGEDEITVSIARNGELLLTNGYHRLSIAKILGTKEIAIKVTVRHSDWINFLKRPTTHPRKKEVSDLFQCFQHPDLANVALYYEDDDLSSSETASR